MRAVRKIAALPAPWREWLVWLIFAVCAAAAAQLLIRASAIGFFLALPICLAISVSGGAALVLGVVAAFRRRGRPRSKAGRRTGAVAAAVAGAAMVVLGVAGTVPTFRGLVSALSWESLLINRGTYLDVARRFEAGEIAPTTDDWKQRESGVEVVLENGPPKRVAFPVAYFFLDNWQGIVYDPSGAVAAARGYAPDRPRAAPAEISNLFSGEMVECDHMTGPFYQCSFS